MNPDEAFETFCQESGFSVAHGMSAEASVIKKPNREDRLSRSSGDLDMFSRSGTPFVPAGEGFLSRIEPGAVGSSLVLIALISAIGFGGYSVLQEVQRVQVAPVEQTPVVLSDLDPLDGALVELSDAATDSDAPTAMDQPQLEALDRLYRPQALDVPVLVARDAPIATIDPRTIGNFVSPPEPDVTPEEQVVEMIGPMPQFPITTPQVSEPVGPALRMVAVRPSWVRVRAADGTVIFETIMEPGDTWDAPVTEEPPTLRTGESGAIYFALSGEYYGPVGETGTITSNLPLDADALRETYSIADLSADEALATTVVELQTPVDAPSE
jgi:hypothetical protein